MRRWQSQARITGVLRRIPCPIIPTATEGSDQRDAKTPNRFPNLIDKVRFRWHRSDAADSATCPDATFQKALHASTCIRNA